MESILSLPKNCMVFLRIIPVKKVDEVHRIVYNTESAERISVTVHTGVNSNIVRTVTNRQKEKICLKIILTSILFVIYFESQSI